MGRPRCTAHLAVVPVSAPRRDLVGALRDRDTMRAIAFDADLSQDAKLFAFCLLVHLADPGAGHEGQDWVRAVSELMQPGNAYRVRSVIAADVPRYEVPYVYARCVAVKTRGPDAGGRCCGSPSGGPWLDRDPLTGEGRYIGYCTRHFTDVIRQLRVDREAQWIANGRPSPPANTGGVLARYFRTDWDALYRWAAPDVVPSVRGDAPAAPRLVLIRGGAS